MPSHISAADMPVPNRDHWAFKSPVRPALPKGDSVSAIDRFVRDRLMREELTPAPQADRVTLIRRLSLDLLGLPPTIEEVNCFLKESDGDPKKAYADLVERLLASPHYGERWGRLWLDAARYADSDGFEKDKARQVWFYREWVINAFNRDLPYDRFLIEQIAGDMLPNATQDQIVATGFLRNSMINEEGGIDPEQFRMEAMFDRIDAIGKGMLGLTIQCAQCHDHKYDPISQVDYYRMFAFLNNCHEASAAVYSPEEQKQRAGIFRKIREMEDDLRHRHPDWLARMQAWEAGMKKAAPAWTIVRPQLDASGGQKHYLLEDGSILAQGYAPTKHTTEFTVKVPKGRITAVKLELLNDPNLPLSGPGRSIKGTFALTEFRVLAGTTEVPIASAIADANPSGSELEAIFDDKSKKRRTIGPVAAAIDRKDDTAWSNDIGPGRSNVPVRAVFTFAKPIEATEGMSLTFKLEQKHGGWNSDDNQNNNLGRFRFSITGAELPEADQRPARLARLFAKEPAQRTDAENEALFAFWRTTVPEWKETNAQIERLWEDHPAGSSQLVLESRTPMRDTHLLKRGDFLKPAEKVTVGVPGVLHPLKDEKADRLSFAKWLADRQSPTTARSFVNRVWQAYFGIGLVSTSEDLGVQCEPPSHPELLDWLAVEFMEPSDKNVTPWSVKQLHRLIVMSETYKQSSKATPAMLERDRDNRLLARGPRFRVDAEVVRDIALSASGLLDRRIGGRSIYPPLPAFMLLPPISYGPKTWHEDTGPERYRRSMYVFRFRSLPYPILQTFDAPNGDFSCVRRPRSNTPLQALMTLNEPIMVEAARALGMKVLSDGGSSDEAKLTDAFQRCVSRKPTDEEKATLLNLLKKQQARFSKADAKPWELAAADPKYPPKLPQGTTPADAAAWTVIARVLLNLDETITRE